MDFELPSTEHALCDFHTDGFFPINYLWSFPFLGGFLIQLWISRLLPLPFPGTTSFVLVTVTSDLISSNLYLNAIIGYCTLYFSFNLSLLLRLLYFTSVLSTISLDSKFSVPLLY